MSSSGNAGSPGLVTAAALAAGALAVFGALNSYQLSGDNAEQYPDAYGGAVAQVRFAPLDARVPASAELGYFTNLEPSQPAYAPAFLAAQYAVAPRLLVLLKNQNARGNAAAQIRLEWAVGNFSKPLDYAAAGRAQGYALAADLGNGVVLFHRGSP
jgi:hypothetical protein